jgi:DNA-binding GntR family transcriptional regulator
MSLRGEALSSALGAHGGGLERASVTERVADVLRAKITDGTLTPGTRLSEEAVGGALGVSRNTLREAFRLLGHERLLEYQLNRGVFVRALTAADVVDLYRVRRTIQLSVIRELTSVTAEALAPVREAVEAGEDRSARELWDEVGTANMHFHEALVGLAGSTRLDDFMRTVLAELRLVFHVPHDPRALHEPYIGRNRRILGLLERMDTAAAEAELDDYLRSAEQDLIGSFAAAAQASGAPAAPA